MLNIRLILSFIIIIPNNIINDIILLGIMCAYVLHLLSISGEVSYRRHE